MLLDHFHFSLNHFRFCVCVSLDNPSNFLVQERSFDEGSDWKLAKLFLADWLSSCLTSWLSKVHTIKANIQHFNNIVLPLIPSYSLSFVSPRALNWFHEFLEKLVICVLLCECLCVLSVVKQCIKAGMWVSGVSKSSWSLWLQSCLSVCLSLSLPAITVTIFSSSSSNSTSVTVFSSSPSSVFVWLLTLENSRLSSLTLSLPCPVSLS